MTTAQATADHVSEPRAESESEEPNLDKYLMSHSYDGIQEYDNPLPGWWRMFFVGTIVFAGFYGLYFGVMGLGTSIDDLYKADLARYDAKKELRDRASMANISEESLQKATADGNVVARGAAVFGIRCVSCHGPEGAGLIGPNLTDGAQLHGSTRVDIFKTVNGGFPGSAMPAWGEQLPQSDVLAAAAFAITLRGKNLPGKPPEGHPVGAFSP